MQKTLPNSYHIFLFPFKWDYLKNNDILKLSFDEKVDIKKFIEFLNKKWKYNKVNINNDKMFNEYYYFYEHVRDAIYSKEDEIAKDFLKQTVFNFTYSDLEKENGEYIISIQEKEYKLDLEEIKLKVYSTGVGILSFHLSNRSYDSAEDILKINDYGRRIYPQFLPIEKTKGAFLANKIIIKIGNEIIEENFSHYENSYELNLSDTIMKLLGEKFKDNKSKLNSGDIYIKPIIDDRMFTICWYGHGKDPEIEILYDYKENEYGYINSDFWHKYLFVDAKDSSCQSKVMLKDLMKKHTYDRWIDYKNLYGITRYSFMELFDPVAAGDFSYVLLTHMQTMYFQMVCLILAQRASILRFSDEATHIATLNEIDENNDVYDMQVILKVRSLYKQYIQFINKMHFREVTPQEQGIELYNKIIQATGIKDEIKNLDEELDELHRYSTMIESKQNLAQEKRIGKIINLITFLGVPLAWSQVVTSLFDLKFSLEMRNILKILGLIGLPTILFVIPCYFYINHYKHSSNNKK